MPNWRKVILSGSNAMLNQITASGLPDGAGTEQLVAISSNGGFVQVGQGNLQSIIDGDWFINEADGYLSASKDVHITGSLFVSGNIQSTGDIIANQYIVRSTVTQVTQSFSSGSTIFGDTNNDTHQFTGSILILHTSSVDQANNIGLQISGSGLLIDNGEHGKLAMGQHNVGLEFAGVGFPITGSGLIISQSFINEATHHNMVKIGETELVDISGSFQTDSFLLNVRNKALVVSSSTLDKPVAQIEAGTTAFYGSTAGKKVITLSGDDLILGADGGTDVITALGTAIKLNSGDVRIRALNANPTSTAHLLYSNANPHNAAAVNSTDARVNSTPLNTSFPFFGGAVTASAVSSSGLLFASLSYADGTQFQVVLYDSSSGRFYHTGSSIGGGSTGGGLSKAYGFVNLANSAGDLLVTLDAEEDGLNYLEFRSGSNITLTGTDDASSESDAADIININAIPTGSNSHIQYNDSGLFGGTGSFVFNDVAKSVTVGNISGPTNITSPSIYEATQGNLYAGEAGTKHQMTDGQPLSTNARYVKARYDIVGLGRGALAGGAIDHTVGSSPTPQGVAFGTFPAFNVLEGNSTTIGGDLTIGNLFAETNDLGKTRLYVNGLYIQPGSPGILLEDGVISFYPSASVTHSNDTSGSIITPLASASGKISLTEAVNPINTTFDIIGRRTTQFKSGDSGSEKNYMMFDKATGVFGIGDGISSGDISKISNKALFISGAFKTTGSSEFDSVTLTHGSELKGTSTEGSDVLIAKIDSNSRIQLGNTGDNLSINAPLTASKVHFSDAGQFQFEANELSLANLPANNNSLMFLGQPARVIPRTGEVTLSSYPDNILLRQAKIGVQEIDGISGGGGAAAQGGHFGATMFAEVDALDIRNPRTGSDGGRSGILFTSNPNIFFFNDNAIGSVSGSNVPDSASAQIKFDTGSNALKFFAGSTTETLKEVLHISKSGDNPRIGIGTTDPKTVFDFKDVEDTTTGAELLIRSARSTQGAITGDEGGSINFIIDSGSFIDLKTTGSLAKIKSKVTDVGTGGAQGKLVFELSKEVGGTTVDVFEYGYNIGGQSLFAAVQTASLIIKDFSNTGESVLEMRDFSNGLRFSVNDGDVEISGSLGVTGSATFGSTVDIGDTLSIPGFSNVSASLAAAVAGGDNLGNHTATLDLNLNGNNIKGITNITASGDISASGNIIIGSPSIIALNNAVNQDYIAYDGTGFNYKGHGKFQGNLIAAGNISASGNLNINQITSSGAANIGGVLTIPGFANVSASLAAAGGTSVPDGTLSGSAQIATEISGAFRATSASFSTRVTANEATSASFSTRVTANEAASASFSTRVTANDAKVGYTDAAVTSVINAAGIVSSSAQFGSSDNVIFGTIEATSLNVTSITSSIVTSSIVQTEGSNIFGDTSADTHTFTGSLLITGGLDIDSGNSTVGGSVQIGKLDRPITLTGGNSFLATRPTITGGGSSYVSFDTGLNLVNEKKISFDGDTTNTYIAANSESPEDLEIHADQDIILNPDGQVIVNSNISSSGQILTEAGPTINTTLASDSATNIDTFNTSSNNGAIYDYTLFSAPSGARAGQCMVIHHNGNADFTDTSTPTLGSETSIPFFETAINGANVEVKIASGSGYTFKAFVKKL